MLKVLGVRNLLGSAAAGALMLGSVLFAVPAARATSGGLECTKFVGHTYASETCTGYGTWRLRIDCAMEPDYIGSWFEQHGGTYKQEGECTFQARNAWIEEQ